MVFRAESWWSSRAFALLLVLASAIPLLLPAVPPLVDLPGHMGRYAIQLAPAGSPLAHWFHFEWGVIGNLGVDLLVMPLGWLLGVELAVKLIVLAIPPLTVAGMLLVAREAHGRLPPTAAFALPLAYGYPFQFGFVNFALSMALALLGFALWLRLGRTGRGCLRAVLFVPFGIMLWFVHSFGWGVLGLAVGAAELARARGEGKRWLASLWEAGLATVPLMPPILLMLLWRSGQVAGMTGDWFNWKTKWYYLQSVLRNDGTAFDFWSALALMALAVAGLVGFGFRRTWLLMIPALILGLTYVLLPRIALGSAYADMRLAPYALAMAVLAVTPRYRDPGLLALTAFVAAGFFFARIGVQTATYARIDAAWRGQLAALDHISAGSRVYVLADLPCLSTPRSDRLDHLDAFTIVRRQSFSNGQWVMAGAQLLRIDYRAPGYYASDPSQVIRPDHCWQAGAPRYPAVLGQFPRAQFDYLWLVGFAPPRLPVGDPGLEAVWQGRTGALYRIRQTPSGG